MYNNHNLSSTKRNYHFQQTSNNIFGTNAVYNSDIKTNGNNLLKKNDFPGLNTNFVSNNVYSNRNVSNNPNSYLSEKSKDNSNNHQYKDISVNTNMNVFGFNKTNSNKFLSNINPSSTMNQQERVITYGQDKNENTFKKNLRKPTVSNLIQNTSYNIITGAPYNSNQNTFGTKYNKSFSSTLNNSINASKPEKIDDLFYSFKNTSLVTNPMTTGRINLDVNKEPEMISSVAESNSPLYFTTFKSIPTPNTHLRNESNYSVKDASSVKEYSYREDQNNRCRNTMEDTHKVVDKFLNDANKGFFSVYDGHGGFEVAKYAKDRMPEVFEKLLTVSKEKEKDPNFVESIMTSAFQKVDDELKFNDSENVGATATVVYITKEKDNTKIGNLRKVIYCANVGDSRCVLITAYGAKRLSYDHKASDPSEVMRITNSGGVIFGGRVFGQLILTRALGDYSLKKHGVVATPYINKHFVTDKDRYLVLASDGIWDVITDDDMYRLHLSISNSEEYVSIILKNAIARGTQDNCSCLVLKLN